jgi:hypothetical protein
MGLDGLLGVIQADFARWQFGQQGVAESGESEAFPLIAAGL